MAGVLPDFGGNTGFYLQIVQSPGTVSIFYVVGAGEKVFAIDGVVFFLAPGRARIDTAMTVDVEVPRFPNVHRTVKLVRGDIV